VSRRTGRRRIAAAVGRLDLPVPFGLDGFGACLQGGRRRPVHLVAFGIAPDLFGAWIRTAAADYLYYEQQASPFHQAHIVANLAGAVLLGHRGGVRLGADAPSDSGPQLAELILGPDSRSTLTRQDTDAFAFLVLDHSSGRRVPRLAARRWLWQSRPLHTALRDVIEPDTDGGRLPVTGVRARLHQQLIQIRSAQLALRPYQDPHTVIAADAAGRAAGLTGDDLAAVTEAAVTAAALRAQHSGTRRRPAMADTSWMHRPSPDLSSEAQWLARVSRAFTRSPVVRNLATAATAGYPAPSAGRELPTGVRDSCTNLKDRARTWQARPDFRRVRG
jgi:Family of unknown function (DUF6545)